MLVLPHAACARSASAFASEADAVAQPHARHPVDLRERARDDQVRVAVDELGHAPIARVLDEVVIRLVDQHHGARRHPRQERLELACRSRSCPSGCWGCRRRRAPCSRRRPRPSRRGRGGRRRRAAAGPPRPSSTFAYWSTASKVGSAATTFRPGPRNAASHSRRISLEPQPSTTRSGAIAVEPRDRLDHALLDVVRVAARDRLAARHRLERLRRGAVRVLVRAQVDERGTGLDVRGACGRNGGRGARRERRADERGEARREMATGPERSGHFFPPRGAGTPDSMPRAPPLRSERP